MKKISLFVMAFFALLVGSVLSACSFKDPKVDFKTSELVISQNSTRQIDGLFDVQGVEKSQIGFLSSDSSLFSIEEGVLSTKDVSGKGFLYATYKNNTINTLSVVVKKKFSAPQNLKFEDGVLTWDAVQEKFDSDSSITSASKYSVSWTYSADGETFDENKKSAEVSNNRFEFVDENGDQFDFGVYKISVYALGSGYFDDGASSEEKVCGFNTMSPATNLVFNDGVLTWESTDPDANFEVLLVGETENTTLANGLVEKQLNFSSLSQGLQNLFVEAKEYKLKVVTHDSTNLHKTDSVSEVLSIHKLAKAEAYFEDGKLELPFVEHAQKFVINVSGSAKSGQAVSQKFEVENAAEGTSTFLKTLSAGTYEISIDAVGGINTMQPDAQVFEDVSKLDTLVLENAETEIFDDAFTVKVSNISGNQIVFVGLDEERVENVLESGIKNFDLTLDNAKIYEITAYQKNTGNVLRSDDSEVFYVTKVADFVGELSHSVQENCDSVFEFSVPTFPTDIDFDILIVGEETDIDFDYQDGKITVAGGIDQYFDASAEEIAKTVRVIASCQGNHVVSFVDLDLKKLASPKTDAEDHSDQHFSWQEVSGATGYSVKAYKIDAATFDSGSFEPAGEAYKVLNLPATQTDISLSEFDVGYYGFEVTALGNDSTALDSDALFKVFYKFKTLEVGDVSFGYGQFEESESTYFVEVGNADTDISEFEFAISEGSFEKKVGENETAYLLKTDFASEKTVSIKAKNNVDSRLFVESELYVLHIKQLDSLTSKNIKFDRLGQNLTIDFSGLENVSKVYVKKDGKNAANFYAGEENAAFKLLETFGENFDLSFDVFGSNSEDVLNEKIYTIENGYVYLPAETKVFSIARLSAPQSLQYQNGQLKVLHENFANAQSYVAILKGTFKDEQSEEIVFDFGANAVEVSYKGKNQTLSQIQTSAQKEMTLEIEEAIFTLCEQDQEFADLFEQFVSLEFSVYAVCVPGESETSLLISSSAATVLGEDGKWLNVQNFASGKYDVSNFKMTTDVDGYAFSWDWGENAKFADEVLFDFYRKGEQEDTKLNSESFQNKSFKINFADQHFDAGERQTYYVKVTNPHFLGETVSKTITLHKLNGIANVMLSSGNLQFEVASDDENNFKEIELYIAGVKKPFDSASRLIEIEGAGEYTLQLVGKMEESVSGDIYHLDSNVSSWTLVDMTSKLPANSNLTIADDKISWEAFQVTQSNMEYVLMFKDQSSKVATITMQLNELQANEILFSDKALSERLSQLSGSITVQLAVHLKNTSDKIKEGNEVYFAAENETLLDTQIVDKFNYAVYSETSNIKRLSVPTLQKLEFLGDSETALTPDIKITLENGNYKGETKFNVYLRGGNSNQQFLKTVSAAETTYEILLPYSDFGSLVSDGEMFTLEIYAVSDEDNPTLPSAIEKFYFKRADVFGSIGFEDADVGLSENLRLTFKSGQEAYAKGGVYVVVTVGEVKSYISQEFDGQDDDVMTVSLKEIIEKQVDGGKISVTAFVKSCSDPVVEGTISRYVLASTCLPTQEFDILPQIKQADIVVEEGTLKVKNVSENARVFLDVNQEKIEMTNENGTFTFVFPDDFVEGTEFSLTFVAKEVGKLPSPSQTKTIKLERIKKVSDVKLERLGDYSVQMTWTGSENAKGYKIDIYDENDNLLTSFDSLDSLANLNDIFGGNYADLTTLDLSKDQRLKFKIVALSNGGDSVPAFNSLAYVFGVTIKGNDFADGDFTVNENGVLSFGGDAGENYVYKLVSTEIDGEDLCTWTQVKGQSGNTIIDTKEITGATTFAVQIFLSGSAVQEKTNIQDMETVQYDFVLDSKIFTTSNAVVLEKLADISSITTDSATGEILFVLKDTSASEREMLVATSQDALTQNPGSVLRIAISMKENEFEAGNDESVWVYDFSKLLKELNLDTNESLTLYFWSFAKAQEQTYISSTVKEFKFVVENDAGLTKIEKLGDKTGNGNIKQNYIDTFAVFKNDAEGRQTLGIYVKIISTSGEILLDKFMTINDLLPQEFYQGQDVYVLNLTDLFEEESLYDFTGEFNVSFARLSLHSGQTVLSKWQDAEKAFLRMNPVSNVLLSDGNLSWSKTDSNQQTYYVYYIASSTSVGKIPDDEQYTYFEISGSATTFNASEHGIAGEDYYIAVQAINTDAYILTSIPTFVGDPSKIRKNQITSLLTLSGGRLFLDWSSSEFVSIIIGTDSPTEKANKLFTKTFEEPFTFSLAQLVDNNVKMKMIFTSLNSAKQSFNYTINVWDLLEDLKIENESITSKIQAIIDGISDRTRQEYLTRLIEHLNNSTNGIASEKLLFDERFEKLQEGGYSLNYYLVGNSQTLSSGMKGFENQNFLDTEGKAKNVLYVNPQPHVNVAIIETKTPGAREFKVVFNKTLIYTSQGSEISTDFAEKYLLRIGTTAYIITAGKSGNGTLEQIENGEKGSISVFESDQNGNTDVEGEKNFLMFYLNYNITNACPEGDSLFGHFGIIEEQLSFEIVAAGNGISLSSKSEYFLIDALRFKQFYIVEGEFVWTLQEERSTMVYVKGSADFVTRQAQEVDPEEIEQPDAKAQGRFVVDEVDDYTIQFVQFGETSGNRIIVDSDIYMIEHAVKLQAPSLLPYFGKLRIDGSANAKTLSGEGTNVAFTTDSKYIYRITNETADSKNLFMKYSDNDNIVYDHEVGLATYSFEGEVDKNLSAYLETEEEATQFSAQMLGSTATFKAEADGKNKFVKTLKCVDGQQLQNRPVAMKSNVSTRPMAMFGAIHRLEIANGVINWQAVQSRNEQFKISDNFKTIYRVVIDPYQMTYGPGSTTPDVPTNLDGISTIVKYTTNNFMDFTQLDLPKVENLRLDVLVQAFAGEISNIKPEKIICEELVEGGYVYGNAFYSGDYSTTYVLMGNCDEVLSGIERLNPVDDSTIIVNPENGRLTWQYYIEKVDVSSFLRQFSFVVEDDEGNEITVRDDKNNIKPGQFDIIQLSANLYQVTFNEIKGTMKTGSFVVTIYATQGSENRDKVIKSYGASKIVYKLAPVNQDTDFVVENSSDNTYEILNFANYYSKSENQKTQIRVTSGLQFVKVTNEKQKIMILSQEEDVELPNDFAGSLVISTQADLTFVVVDEEGSIYSDESDPVTLTRSGWEGAEISWDNEKQIFSWQYKMRTVNSTTRALPRKLAYVTISSTNLYENQVDALRERNTKGTLPSDWVFDNVTIFNTGIAQIEYQGQTYFIKSSVLQRRLVEDESATEIDIDQRMKFEIYFDQEGNEITSEGNTLIIYGGKTYIIETSKINIPTFIIKATYSLQSGEIVRTYTTTSTEFIPNLICSGAEEGLTISVRVKLNKLSIQSSELSYAQPVKIDLFESGDGSLMQPFVITNEMQFKNIAFRMNKPDYLNSYLSNGQNTQEGQSTFYFKLGNDDSITLNLTDDNAFSGVLFPGIFEGKIYGNNSQINFTSTGVSSIKPISVLRGNYTSSATHIVFDLASGLFEEFSNTASVQNLTINARFEGESAVQISSNTMITALVVSNHGRINSVEVSSFENVNFYAGSSSSRVILAFAGFAGTNISSGTGTTAQISDCHNKASFNIIGNNASVGQATFIGGIAISNSAKISNCTMEGENISVICQARNDFVQIGGIVVNNTNGSSLENSTNSANITISANITENDIWAYVGGVCVKQDGSISNVSTTGTILHDKITHFQETTLD